MPYDPFNMTDTGSAPGLAPRGLTGSVLPGLEQQIQEIKEAVELPLTHPELYEEMGIKPPKGTPTAGGFEWRSGC